MFNNLAIRQGKGSFAIERCQCPARTPPHAIEIHINTGQPSGNCHAVIPFEMLENINGQASVFPIIFCPSAAGVEAISTATLSPSSVLADAINRRLLRRGSNGDLRIADGKAGINLK